MKKFKIGERAKIITKCWSPQDSINSFGKIIKIKHVDNKYKFVINQKGDKWYFNELKAIRDKLLK